MKKNIVIRIIEILVIIASIIMVFGMGLEVIMRYIFNSPVYGAEELIRIVAVWFYFLSMAYITRSGDHISGGLYAVFIKNEKAILVIKALTFLIMAVVSFFMLWHFTRFATWSYGAGRVFTASGWTFAYAHLSLIVGLVLTIIFCVEGVVLTLLRGPGKTKEQTPLDIQQ